MIKPPVYLIDTNVISEARKRRRANRGVRSFFDKVRTYDEPLFVSVITVGEIRRGIEIIRHRGDNPQARRLEAWLEAVLRDFDERILEFGNEEAQVWGRLRVPYHENAIDKQIAATALTHDLILVTRNAEHFKALGVRFFNPFD
jgi:toxin FitB